MVARRSTPLPGLLLSCEHGGNRVPRSYRPLFVSAGSALASHRGWDPGALDMARWLSRTMGAPLLAATTTRLLVDVNRSPHNPAVFSRFTRRLGTAERVELLDAHHRPHWESLREEVAARARRSRPLLHLGVHSFTPRLRGERRAFEVGILYDPARPRERAFAREWQRNLRKEDTGIQVRRNAPYRGSADGLTTALRREFGGDRYLGIELELNQAWLAAPAKRRRIARILEHTLRAATWGAKPSRS